MMKNKSIQPIRRSIGGFTLIELMAVIVISGVLAAVAIQKIGIVGEQIKTEETMREMENLNHAIVGNPELCSNGVRSDFGYVGDVGSLPANLDALIIRPKGYSTWRGPYIKNSVEQILDDYKQDAWLSEYDYSGGIEIRSVGSGENIIRRIAINENGILNNRLDGLARDRDGTPPGQLSGDLLTIKLTHPNGIGGTKVRFATIDNGGYFRFDSVPIGLHRLELIYLPENDSITRYVTVSPSSNPYVECFFSFDIWSLSPENSKIRVGSRP